MIKKIYQSFSNSFFLSLNGIFLSLVIFFPNNIPNIFKVIVHLLVGLSIYPNSKNLLTQKFKLIKSVILFLPAIILISNTLLNGSYYLFENSIQILFNLIIIFFLYNNLDSINYKNKFYLKNLFYFLRSFIITSFPLLFLNLIKYFQSPLLYNKGRLHFGILNPNIAGFNLLIIALSILTLFELSKSLKIFSNVLYFLNFKFVQLIISITMLIPIFFTGSRTNLISYLLFLIVFLVNNVSNKFNLVKTLNNIFFKRKLKIKEINYLIFFTIFSFSFLNLIYFLNQNLRVLNDIRIRLYSLSVRAANFNLFLDYFDKPGIAVYDKLYDLYGFITLDSSFLESYFLLGPIVSIFFILIVIKPSFKVYNFCRTSRSLILLMLIISSYLVLFFGNDFINTLQFYFYYFLVTINIKLFLNFEKEI